VAFEHDTAFERNTAFSDDTGDGRCGGEQLC
jgi:hypothetical protein